MPATLLAPIEIPSRNGIATVGDMVRLIMADEAAMRLKNADLAAARAILEAREGANAD